MLEPENERVYNDKELNYPLGSFFNRYLLNKIELHYPYFENVRPRESLLPLIIKTDFPLAIKVFFKYIPYLIRSIKRRQAWKIFGQTITFALILLFGLVFVGVVVWQAFGSDLTNIFASASSGSSASSPGGTIEKYLLSLAETVGGLILTYYLSRLLSLAQLEEPSSLYSDTGKIFKAYPNVQIITLGHTHNPEQFKNPVAASDTDSRWFYNTGTWIPIVDTTTGSLREDKTYTYLYFTHDDSGKILPRPLYRWDDDASRGETLTLVEIEAG